MTDEREHPSPSESSPRLDVLETRMAAVESRLDHIDAALRALNEFLSQQSLLTKNQQLLLEKLKREQESIAYQTRSFSADEYERNLPLRLLFGMIGAFVVIVLFWGELKQAFGG